MFSSEAEIFLVTGISNLSLLAYNTFPFNNIFFDFVFWVLPQYWIIIHPEDKYHLIGFLVNLVDLGHFTKRQAFKERNDIKDKDDINDKNDKNDIKDKDDKNEKNGNLNHHTISNQCKKVNQSIIGILRSYIACQVAICILAVDFKGIFPTKFGKSLDFGYKLMDIGVGSYLYNTGLMIKKTNIAFLFILGLIRYLTILIFKLEVEITEYGRHSNFYFILAAVQLLYKILPFTRMGYIILILYHIITRYYKLDQLILNTQRNSFILQNKETLFVIIPFLCLVMIVQDVRCILFEINKNFSENLKYKIKNLSIYTTLYYALYRIFLTYEEPSRRLGNPTFIFLILYLHTAHLLIYVLVSVLTQFTKHTSLDFVSRNMMTNFLLTNILVLILKQLINFKDEQCHFTMITYLIISFSIPPLLRNWRDKTAGNKL